MDLTDTAQPFSLTQLVVLEKRDADGKLDFSPPFPPSDPLFFDDVYKLFFNANPAAMSAGWPELRAWLAGKQWHIRPCTWLREPEWMTKAKDAGWRSSGK